VNDGVVCDCSSEFDEDFPFRAWGLMRKCV
jgi:hypothetical protein